MKVTPLISVAMIDPHTANHGSDFPPAKKSLIVACFPRIMCPTTVVRAKYPNTTNQSIALNAFTRAKLPDFPAHVQIPSRAARDKIPLLFAASGLDGKTHCANIPTLTKSSPRPENRSISPLKHRHQQTWPRVNSHDHQIACHFCDTLHEVTLIEEGLSAECKVCGKTLYQNRAKSVERATAFALAALFLMILIQIFPFMSINAQGNTVSMDLDESVKNLWHIGGPFVAFAVAVFVLLLPALQALIILYLCAPLMFGASFPFALGIARIHQQIQPWVMLEVFFLATLVSLLKLARLADVSLDVGFWSLVGLMICLAGALSAIDRLELWDRIEVSRRISGKTKHAR